MNEYLAVPGHAIACDGHIRLGRSGEEAAASYLRRRLYEIIDTNYRTRYGEIDIIARRGGIIVFVEVKTRRGDSFGRPFEAVGPRKQEQIRRMALAWLAVRHYDPVVRASSFRFDVISVAAGPDGRAAGIEHIENAFS